MASYSYTYGPTYYVPLLTMGGFVRICNAITEAFNAKNGDGHCFEPEPISEGGIICRRWPGQKPGEYKTMRLYIKSCHRGGYARSAMPVSCGCRYDEVRRCSGPVRRSCFNCMYDQVPGSNYPWVDSNWRTTWTDDTSYLIPPVPDYSSHPMYVDTKKYTRAQRERGTELGSFLKAFHGAPVWTEDELLTIDRVLTDHGWARKGNARSVLSKAKLKGLREIGSLGLPRPPRKKHH